MISVDVVQVILCPFCAAGDMPANGIHRIPDQQMRGHFEEPECPAWPIIVAAEER